MVATSSRRALVAALVLTCGCAEFPEDAVPGADPLLSHVDGGTFNDTTLPEIHNTTAENPKSFWFRVTRGQPVSVTLTKNSGNDSLRFTLAFSDTSNGTYVNSSCVNAAHGSTHTCNDVAGASGDGYARITVSVTAGTAGFTLDRTFTGPCSVGHACYEQDTTRVGNIPRNEHKKAMILGELPRMYAGQSATVIITRSHGNVVVTGGVKIKLDDANNQEANFDCDPDDDGVLWVAGAGSTATMTCTIGPVTEDGEIHIPFIRSNNTASPARSAVVVIQRSGLSGYVRPGQIWHY